MAATLLPRLLALSALAVGALWAAGGAAADYPNPCTLVPAATIASTVGGHLKGTPVSSATSTGATCSWQNGKLTVQIGSTALTNPAAPLKTTKVATLPHGVFTTYTHSTQTQIVFIEGSTASGLYVVVRNYARIPQKKLVALAGKLHAALAGTSAGGGVRLITP